MKERKCIITVGAIPRTALRKVLFLNGINFTEDKGFWTSTFYIQNMSDKCLEEINELKGLITK